MLRLRHVTAAVFCLVALCGCSSISQDIHSVKTGVVNDALRGVEHEVSELGRQFEHGHGSAASAIHGIKELAQRLHLKRPKGVSGSEWTATLHEDLKKLEAARR